MSPHEKRIITSFIILSSPFKHIPLSPQVSNTNPTAKCAPAAILRNIRRAFIPFNTCFYSFLTVVIQMQHYASHAFIIKLHCKRRFRKHTQPHCIKPHTHFHTPISPFSATFSKPLFHILCHTLRCHILHYAAIAGVVEVLTSWLAKHVALTHTLTHSSSTRPWILSSRV